MKDKVNGERWLLTPEPKITIGGMTPEEFERNVAINRKLDIIINKLDKIMEILGEEDNYGDNL